MRRRGSSHRGVRRAVLLVGAAVGLVSALGAPGAALGAPTGSISGTVTDEVTHNPVAGVPVCATFDWFEEDWTCSQTDGAGEYEIGELAPGEYTVEFMPGNAGLNYLYEAWEDRRIRFEGNPVTVEAGPVQDVDAELGEGGELRGRVTNSVSGAPVEGVEVCAEPWQWGVEEGCALTNADGEYTIFGLGSGEYVVGFFAPEELELLSQYWDGRSRLLEANPITASVGTATDDVDASMVPGARISGTVTDAITRAPLEGAAACAEAAGGGPYLAEYGGCGTSDAAGRYTIRWVPAGFYGVRFFPESELHAGGWYTGDPCRREPLTVEAIAGRETGGIDVGLFPREVFPTCSEPAEPERREPPLLEIRWIKSRTDGKLAIGLRVRRGGTLTLTASTRRRSSSGRRKVVAIARKRVAVISGPPMFRLTPRGFGRRLLRARGKLRARLAIDFVTRYGRTAAIHRRVVFRLGRGRPKQARRSGHRRVR